MRSRDSALRAVGRFKVSIATESRSFRFNNSTLFSRVGVATSIDVLPVGLSQGFNALYSTLCSCPTQAGQDDYLLETRYRQSIP